MVFKVSNFAALLEELEVRVRGLQPPTSTTATTVTTSATPTPEAPEKIRREVGEDIEPLGRDVKKGSDANEASKDDDIKPLSKEARKENDVDSLSAKAKNRAVQGTNAWVPESVKSEPEQT